MDYGDFMNGLYQKFHISYLKSKSYVKFGGQTNESANFEDKIIAKVDSEAMLEKIKNKNMVKALCLIAQGYEQWEVAVMLNKSVRTIEWYVAEMKRILKNFQ